MNFAEALLAADTGKMTAKATKKVEIPRLTKLLGFPFVLELKQISARRIQEIQMRGTKINEDKSVEIDNGKLNMGMLCDGISNKEFDQPDILKKFGCATRKDLFMKLFKPGEIQDIAEAISKLCGYSVKNLQDMTEQVKN